MRRYIFLVDSLFDVSIAIRIRRVFFAEDECDIVLSDLGGGLRELYDKGSLSDQFEKVYYADHKRVDRKVRLAGLLDPLSVFEKLLGIEKSRFYTDVFFWSPTDIFYYLYMGFEQAKRPLKLHVYSDAFEGWFLNAPDDDHPGGYQLYGAKPLQKFIEKKYGWKMIGEMSYDYYLYFPEYSRIEHTHPTVSVPVWDYKDETQRALLNGVYDFDSAYEIKEDFILLDGPDSRWRSRDEHHAVINEIVKAVGKDNLIIKAHPRTPRELYEGCEAKIEEAVYTWDMYCMNHDIGDKTLLIYDGTSGFLPFLFYDQHPKLVTLRSLLGENTPEYDDTKWDWFVKLVKKDIKGNEPKSMEELKLLFSFI